MIDSVYRSKSLKVAIVIALCAWVWFIWPTPWQYFKSGEKNLRINRLSGEVQYLSPKGWIAPPDPNTHWL